LDVDILAGTPFMETNDVAVRSAKREVILGDGTVFTYGSSPSSGCNASARRAFVLRAPPSKETIWPGDFIEMQLLEEAQPDSDYATEPRTDSPSFRKLQQSQIWPQPSIVSSFKPRMLRRNEHFCQATPVFEPGDDSIEVPQPSVASPPPLPGSHSSAVKIDSDNLLPPDIRVSFRSLLKEYNSVFDPKITGYNGAADPFKAKVNMGPIEPPQRRGCLPQYARGKLVELQDKFDQLEEVGVLQSPEEIDITVEYLNPSFLVKRPNGGSRLVTAFADVVRYSKPQPSLLSYVDSTLRQIAQWKHIIISDLTSAFYQIPLARESMKYCGFATPFKGVRVYTRTAMGMPGSETALEEIMCCVLGDLLQQGIVTKIADDLYCGGNSPQELL